MWQPLLLWNPINIIDSEASWLLSLIGLLILVSIASRIVLWAYDRLHETFVQTGQYWKDASLSALLHPLLFYMWFLLAVWAVDLISDRLLSESLSGPLIMLLRVVAVGTFGWFLIRLKRNVTEQLLHMRATGQVVMPPAKILGIAKLITALISILIVLLLMDVTGISVNTILAFGGISGLAIAIASQEVISNLFAGLVIHFKRPFVVGDYIQVPANSLEGSVEETGWYMTMLHNSDRLPVYVPNSLFSKTFVINATRRKQRRLLETINIRQEDIERVPAILGAWRSMFSRTVGIDRSQSILVSIGEIGAYAITLKMNVLSAYVDEREFLRLRDEVLMQAVQAVEENGAKLALFNPYVHA